MVVVGAGGHAAEICGYLADAIAAGERVRLLGCVDDNKPTGRSGGIEILGDLTVLERLVRSTDNRLEAITAVGDNPTRQRLVERVRALCGTALRWRTVRHPAASVGGDAVIGEGTLVAPGAIVTARVRIGSHAILNVHGSVSHDCIVGDYVNVNPGAVIAGNVRLGTGCYIGAGATIIDRCEVGEWAIVGAGACVVRDVPPRVTAVGVPARVTKHHAVTAS